MIDEFMSRCRRQAWATYLGNGRIACRALGRYNLIVDANDIGMTPNIVCDGYWEPGISVVFENVLKPGMTAVDIGANVGYFTLLMASRVAPAGRVVSIEANPTLAELLGESIRMNGLEEMVTVHNTAVADRAREVDFYITPDRNLNGCIMQDEWRTAIDPKYLRKVDAVAPDDLLAGIGRVDIVKIDVEGAEHLVWKGLERTLADNRDIIVILEYNYARHSAAGELVLMVESQGFPLRFIDPAGAIRPVEREALFDAGNVDDWMLFLKRGEIPS